MFEYKSDTRTGSKPVSAAGNEIRRNFAGSAAVAEAAISSATRTVANRRNLGTYAPRMKKRRNVTFSAANSPTPHRRDWTARRADRCAAGCRTPSYRYPPYRRRPAAPRPDDQTALLG